MAAAATATAAATTAAAAAAAATDDPSNPTKPNSSTATATATEPAVVTTLECPRALIGRLIGRAGVTIKGVQIFSGAVVEVNQRQEPARISIFGSAQSVQVAESIVNDIMAGTFKGFALLRDLVASRESPIMAPAAFRNPSSSSSYSAYGCRGVSSGDGDEDAIVYAPGVGILPRRQLYAANMAVQANFAAGATPTSGIGSNTSNSSNIENNTISDNNNNNFSSNNVIDNSNNNNSGGVCKPAVAFTRAAAAAIGAEDNKGTRGSVLSACANQTAGSLGGHDAAAGIVAAGIGGGGNGLVLDAAAQAAVLLLLQQQQQQQQQQQHAQAQQLLVQLQALQQLQQEKQQLPIVGYSFSEPAAAVPAGSSNNNAAVAWIAELMRHCAM